MASLAQRGRNEPEIRPIIVKKVIVAAHEAPHGGAWKVAYADFVTAMMAFFLLLWLLGATDEQKRKGIADYFTPTLVQLKEKSAGSNGLLGGDSIVGRDDYPHRAAQTGSRGLTIPRAATGGSMEGESGQNPDDKAKFDRLKKTINAQMDSRADLRRFKNHVRLTDTREGLRIDLVDEADFSMFKIGTDQLVPEAVRLIGEVAKVIAAVPNPVMVRGHTDALPYAAGQTMNNWLLSTARAEATRAALAAAGLDTARFARIEGVADREPFIPDNSYDPRNRRMSITLAWSGHADSPIHVDTGIAPPHIDAPPRGGR